MKLILHFIVLMTLMFLIRSNCTRYDSYFDVYLYGDKKLCIPDFNQKELKNEAIDQIQKDFGFNMTEHVDGVMFLNCRFNNAYTSIISGGYSKKFNLSMIQFC